MGWLRRLLEGSRNKVVILDDDPTGTQTVSGVDIVTRWSTGLLAEMFRSPERAFFILTNSRSLPEPEARALTREILERVCEASQIAGRPFTLVSRSDSTLRGHYPAELDEAEAVLKERLGKELWGRVLFPAFIEGGRVTFDDIHWAEVGGRLVPVGETEFAADPALGYTSSNLRDWVVEKSRGTARPEQVVSLPLEVTREQGPSGLLEIILAAPRGVTFIPNAVTYDDIRFVTIAFLEAEARGREYLYRTAASFVPVYAGVELRPPLSPEELGSYVWPHAEAGGLVVVGSHVGKTTAQLEALLALPGTTGIELSVPAVLDEATRQGEITRVVQEMHRELQRGQDVVVYTSRSVLREVASLDYLEIGKRVAAALVEIVRSLAVVPRFIIGKGGITSSVLATDALECTRARVLGQVAPGVPIWQLDDGSRLPRGLFVVFPGNVGSPRTLADTVMLMRRT